MYFNRRKRVLSQNCEYAWIVSSGITSLTILLIESFRVPPQPIHPFQWRVWNRFPRGVRFHSRRTECRFQANLGRVSLFDFTTEDVLACIQPTEGTLPLLSFSLLGLTRALHLFASVEIMMWVIDLHPVQYLVFVQHSETSIWRSGRMAPTT